MYVDTRNVAQMRFVAQITTIVQHVNVSLVIVEIHNLNVFVLNAHPTSNARITWHVSMKNVAIHAIVVKEHYVVWIIIVLLADAHLATKETPLYDAR